MISPGASEQAILLSADYLKVYCMFGPLIPVYFALDNYLRVCGKQRLSMVIGITSKLLNVALAEMSITAIRIFSFSYLVGWIDMCFSSYFTALDRPGRSFLVSLFGTLVFPVAFLFILSAIWGLNGVWLMATVAALASGILTLILARTLKLE